MSGRYESTVGLGHPQHQWPATDGRAFCRAILWFCDDLRSRIQAHERKKYKIERHTRALFAAWAHMLGSRLPVFS
jgi:hypothetical protein